MRGSMDAVVALRQVRVVAQRTTLIAITAAAGVAILGMLLRGMSPELVRYVRMKRM